MVSLISLLKQQQPQRAQTGSFAVVAAFHSNVAPISNQSNNAATEHHH